MDLKELTDLISVRQYIIQSINIPYVPRPKVNELNNILILLDNKIIDIILGPQFKEYMNFENVKKAVADAVTVSNIKSSFKK